MKITRIGDGLAIVIPPEIAEAIGLRENDDITVRATSDGKMELVRGDDWLTTLTIIKRLERSLPADYQFNREEANAR
jgi:antitoxin MazE